MPAGFMPGFGENRVQIVLCDDAGTLIGATTHHGHHGKSDRSKHRQSCPYAAAAANPLLAPPATAAVLQPTADSVSQSGAEPVQIFLQRKVDRPPSRAPPVLA